MITQPLSQMYLRKIGFLQKRIGMLGLLKYNTKLLPSIRFNNSWIVHSRPIGFQKIDFVKLKTFQMVMAVQKNISFGLDWIKIYIYANPKMYLRW